jgi:hypothetical protein
VERLAQSWGRSKEKKRKRAGGVVTKVKNGDSGLKVSNLPGQTRACKPLLALFIHARTRFMYRSHVCM